jgi:hypothetical protein
MPTDWSVYITVDRKASFRMTAETPSRTNPKAESAQASGRYRLKPDAVDMTSATTTPARRASIRVSVLR